MNVGGEGVFRKTKLSALERFHKGELVMLLTRWEGIMYKRFWGSYKSLQEFRS